MTRSRAAVWVLAAVLGMTGCGKSKIERAFEEVGRQCVAAPANDLSVNALNQSIGTDVYAIIQPPCDATSTLNGSVCTPVDPQHPQCPTLFYWIPNDPNMCGAQGCWVVCEVRQNSADVKAAVDAGHDPNDVPVCAARFLEQMPPP
jgi:hypothetical protein